MLTLVWMIVCFFFFKQKAAYEMRISDWSSDVCSSDLASSLFLACASLPCAFTVAASASASLATASLKEGRAPRAPRLLFVRVGRFHSGEQRTGERVQIERIGPGGRDQLAELLDLAGLQSLGLVVQRPQF